MKVFVFFLALLFPAALMADPCPLTYKVRAVEVVPQPGVKSCGATKRMLKDRHRIVQRPDGTILVNGMRWGNIVGSELPGEAYLAYHRDFQQKVWLSMWVYANDNKIIGLYAINDDGKKCQDIVRLEGVRL